MKSTKEKFLNQLQEIYKLETMPTLTSFLYGEEALLLKLYLKEATNPKDLAQILGVTKGRITAIIGSLRKKAYLDIEQNKLDKRKKDLVFTTKGLHYIETRLWIVDTYFDKLLTHLGEDTSKELIDVLDKLLTKLKTFEVKHHG